MTISGVPFIRCAPERKFRRLASQLARNDLEQQRVAEPPRQRRFATVTRLSVCAQPASRRLLARRGRRIRWWIRRTRSTLLFPVLSNDAFRFAFVEACQLSQGNRKPMKPGILYFIGFSLELLSQLSLWLSGWINPMNAA